MRRLDIFGPLADRSFRLLWLAATTSAVGSAFVTVAMAFAVLSIGGNATSLGLVLLVGTGAGTASFQIAGVWADRLSRRNLMLAADLVRLVVEAAVAVLLLTGHARIWELAIGNALGNMTLDIFLVLGPVLAVQRLGGASGWGLVSSGMAVGVLLGGLGAIWHKPRRPIAFGMAITALTALPMLALAARLPLYLIVAAAVVGMSGVLVLNTNWATTIQQLVPNEMLSRFRSYDYMLAFIAMPVGYAIAGPLETAFGADEVLVAAAVVAVVANAIPAMLPAVRAVIRHREGTITGPPCRRLGSGERGLDPR